VTAIEGTVVSGLGRAGQKLEAMASDTRNQLGFLPYPGTLNIQLNDVFTFPVSPVCIDVPELGRKRVPFRLFRACLNGHPVWVARSLSQLEDSDSLLEIIADTKLREALSLSDGDLVQIEFDGP
jgi:CTP-dependent riboflavin kinase